jgi:uncharacterized protein GlcG (DUF336 family)
MDGLVTRKTMSHAVAGRLLAYVEAQAREQGDVGLCAVVCDESGILVGLIRTDGARPHNVTLACGKAQTAASFGMSTDAWRGIGAQDAAVTLGLLGGLDHVALFGGGVPVRVDGEVVGALGVSGPDEQQDGAIAAAAVSAVVDG